MAGAFGTGPLLTILSVVAVLSMLAGNLLALLQSNVKRILAYSSIAHLGYALVAFLSGGTLAVEAVSLYLVAYAITSLGAFGLYYYLRIIIAMVQPPAEGGARWAAPRLGNAVMVILFALLIGSASIPRRSCA